MSKPLLVGSFFVVHIVSCQPIKRKIKNASNDNYNKLFIILQHCIPY